MADEMGTTTYMNMANEAQDIEEFAKTYAEKMKPIPAHIYLKKLIKDRGMTQAQAAEAADIRENYYRQLLSGAREFTRDRLLRFAIVLKLDAEETTRLLKYAHLSVLYPRFKRDLGIMFALKHKMGLTDTQNLLSDLGEPILTGGGRDEGNDAVQEEHAEKEKNQTKRKK
jgi:transcriptional regulator with XRE-family HTH domain